MIAKRMEDRFQTMDEVAAALAPFSGDASLGGSAGGSSPSVSRNADLASFMQSLGTGGGTKTNVSATQIKPGTSTNIDATAQFTSPEVGTDPKSMVMTKGASPTVASATKPKPLAKKSKGSNNRTKLIAAGALSAVLLLAGIIVKIRDKDGNVVAEVNSPTGTSAEVITTPQPGVKPIAPAIPVTPATSTLTLAQLFDSPDYEWSKPENLGPSINGPKKDAGVSLSDDQLCIFYDGALGRVEATRSSTSVPFNTPTGSTNLGDPVLSGDGLSLVGSTRVADKLDVLTEVHRATRDARWNWNGTNLCAQADTPEQERSMSLSANGLALLFRIYTATEGADLWISRRTTRQGSFGPAEKLGPFVNTNKTESRGFMFGDKQTILFVRDAIWFYTFTNASGTKQGDCTLTHVPKRTSLR